MPCKHACTQFRWFSLQKLSEISINEEFGGPNDRTVYRNITTKFQNNANVNGSFYFDECKILEAYGCALSLSNIDSEFLVNHVLDIVELLNA